MLVSKYGLRKCVIPLALALNVPDLLYVWMSVAQPDTRWLIGSCVGFEQFGYGIGFTAYMLYLIYFCQGEHKTAHYAICTGFMAASLMLPGMIAGWLEDMLGYSTFFVVVTVLCVITFIVSALVKIDPEFGRKKKE